MTSSPGVATDMTQAAHSQSSTVTGDDLSTLAETIHKARWPADRQMAITPFADEDQNAREYCFRIARAVMAQHGAPAQRQPESAAWRKTLSKIKRLALNVKSEDVPRTLAHIARLCIDAGSPPSSLRNWSEDASHENGNYECLCCECDQTFIGHKRRVFCKACSTLLSPATSTLPSTDRPSPDSKLEAYRKALEPFAKAADVFDDSFYGDSLKLGTEKLSLGMLRAARKTFLAGE